MAIIGGQEMFEKLKLFITENHRINREHYYQYHHHPAGRNNCKNTEKHFTAVSAGELAFKMQAIIKGDINIDKIFNELPSEIGEDLKDVSNLRQETREEFLKAVTDEIVIQEKAIAEAFASEQLKKLIEMGYSKYKARQILNAAGPHYCVEVAVWVKQLLDSSKDADLVTVVLRGLDKAPFGKNRIETLLQKLGLPVPSVSTTEELRKFLLCAKEAL